MRFLVWLAIGFIIYFVYARTHARLHTGKTLSSDVQAQMELGILTPKENR